MKNYQLTKNQKRYLKAKRVMDFFIALVAVIALMPVYALISLFIFIDDPGPVIFTQDRVGERKKIFKLYKFRTMKVCTPHDVPTHL